MALRCLFLVVVSFLGTAASCYSACGPGLEMVGHSWTLCNVRCFVCKAQVLSSGSVSKSQARPLLPPPGGRWVCSQPFKTSAQLFDMRDYATLLQEPVQGHQGNPVAKAKAANSAHGASVRRIGMPKPRKHEVQPPGSSLTAARHGHHTSRGLRSSRCKLQATARLIHKQPICKLDPGKALKWH